MTATRSLELEASFELGSPETASHKPTYDELLARVAQLEQQLAQQHQPTFVELVESIQDGFLALNREWRFTYVNRRAAESG